MVQGKRISLRSIYKEEKMELEEYCHLIEQALKIQNWSYMKDEDEKKMIFSLNFLQNGEYYTKCKVIVNQFGICDMLAYLPFNCPKNDMTKAAGLVRKITEHNYPRRYATIRFNFSDGTIRSSYSFKIFPTMTPEFIIDVFKDVKDIDEDIYSVLKNICKSRREKQQEPFEIIASVSKKDKFRLDL